jgi:hypothetical protein
MEVLQIYQLGGPGTMMRKKRFAHYACVPQKATNYRGEPITYDDYLVVVPAADLERETCCMCGGEMLAMALQAVVR